MDLTQQFEQAIADSKTLSTKPNNEMLLKLYSLYKQGKEGDVQDGPPTNVFDFVGKAKYEAWAALQGMRKEQAMEEYVALVAQLKSD